MALRHFSFAVLVILAALSFSLPSVQSRILKRTGKLAGEQYASVQTIFALQLPGAYLPEADIFDGVDCNSPLHWDERGNLYAFTSVRHPYRSTGPDIFQLAAPTTRTTIVDAPGTTPSIWLEATYRDNDGLLYGWYHHETLQPCANDLHLSVPEIGALVSRDEGLHWEDLGIVMTAPADSLKCDTNNYYFAGGDGDFSVMLDPEKQYFYFFFGSYHREVEEQGIAVARMSYADRLQPIGSVWKWRDNDWGEPGVGGRVTPIFSVLSDWHSATPDAFWGPSIHYNTYLNQYVIVMNHAIDPYWGQEGIYLSYNATLANPNGWSDPNRLPLDPQGRAYPQVVGWEKGETDKLCGRFGRLFLLGESNWLIEFHQDGNDNGGNCDGCIGPAPTREERTGKRPSGPRREAARPGSAPPSRTLALSGSLPARATLPPQRQWVRPARASLRKDLKR